MARNDPQVNLRIPQELKTALEAVSVTNNRSLTAEIVARLERSFEGEKLGLSMDMLDAVAMQSVLILTLQRLLDPAKLSGEEMQILETVCRFAQRIADNTTFTHGGPYQVVTGQPE